MSVLGYILPSMKIAVLGAGYAGLATAWYLLQDSKVQVSLFDPSGIGGQASGLAAGLLHPFVGIHAKLNNQGREGMEATRSLLEISSKAFGKRVYEATGILRVAVTEKQREGFGRCAERYSDVEWWDDCSERVSGVVKEPGIFIRSGITVNSEEYLEGLWQACQDRGAVFERRGIESLEEVDSFDAVVLAMGIETNKFADVSLTPIKGQLLQFAWPQDIEPLPFSINSKAYLAMSSDRKSVIAGATFERDFHSVDPDVEIALAYILPKARIIYPAIDQMELLSCRAAVRVSTPNRLPIAKQVSEKVWVFTGLGSKGLLYHALYAKRLCNEILTQA